MENKYIILDADRVNSIDWTQTHQTADTAYWNIERTQFIISVDASSEYLIEEITYDAFYIRGILADPYWGQIIL